MDNLILRISARNGKQIVACVTEVYTREEALRHGGVGGVIGGVGYYNHAGRHTFMESSEINWFKVLTPDGMILLTQVFTGISDDDEA